MATTTPVRSTVSVGDGDAIATRASPSADEPDGHVWFKRSTRREPAMAERLAEQGITSWHQTPEQYVGVLLKGLGHRVTLLDLTLIIVGILRSLGVGS